jgi:hypothetical protein
MQKAALFAIAAVIDLVLAGYLYQDGRIFLPLVLVVGAVCFTVAAVGSVMKARGA